MVLEENGIPAPCVLLVEDEPMLLMVAAETMRDAGYMVWEAHDGIAALAILGKQVAIDILISDIKMPVMNGYQVAEAALSMRPTLKVMLMTGYAQEPIPKTMVEAGIEILYKPFDIDQLPTLANHILGKG